MVALAVLLPTLLVAGTDNRTVDIRTFMTPVPASKMDQMQITGFQRSMMLSNDMAKTTFADAPATLTLKNFPLPNNEQSTLELRLGRQVFDANTKILVATGHGKEPLKVRPIVSYVGKISGDPNSRVSLHYSDGDLTGFVEQSNGLRTMIGIDVSKRSTATVTPHLIADEQTVFPGGLSKFLCGNESLPFDADALGQAMAQPSTVKDMDKIQSTTALKELRLAIVLREDIHEYMSGTGKTNEQIVQYFAKCVAAFSQAYEEELNATFYISYVLMWTADEVSGYSGDGTNPGMLLEEFSRDWSTNYNNVERDVAHCYTRMIPQGGLFIGGIAYGGQAGPKICSKQHQGAYGVSTMYLNQNMDGIPGRPNMANAFVWDVFVTAHEIGHNVGAPHTHNCFWSPPVDTCQVQSDGTDACYMTGRTPRPGTIMSYCHLVNGSTTPLTFGTRVAERMRAWIDQSCVVQPPRPTVRLTSPRGTETFAGGQQLTIKWSTARVANVKLQYSADNMQSWNPVNQNMLPAADLSYNWTIPAVQTSYLWIRISDASNDAVSDTSLVAYSVRLPLALTSPKGGERFAQGSVQSIRWTKESSVPSVKVEFAPDGTTWQTLEGAATGVSYEWTVPAVVTSTARVRVTSTGNAALTATSEPFSIGVARFAVLIPVEGDSICNNFANQYRWSSDFVDKFKIQYKTPTGTIWQNAVTEIAVDASKEGQQTFGRSNSLGNVEPGTVIQIRFVDYANAENILATLSNIRVASCDAAVSVDETTPAPTDLRIVRVTPNPVKTDAAIELNAAMPMTVDVLLVAPNGAVTTLLAQQNVGTSGPQTLNISLNGVAAGAYQVVVRSGSAQVSTPLSVVR